MDIVIENVQLSGSSLEARVITSVDDACREPTRLDAIARRDAQ